MRRILGLEFQRSKFKIQKPNFYLIHHNNNPISKMDMEKPLKFDGQLFGVQTESDFRQFEQDLFFGKEDQIFHTLSNTNTEYCPLITIIDEIKSNYDIALTPLADLMEVAKQKIRLYSVEEDIFKRKLRKTKIIQKRFRAKNRGKYKVGREIILQKVAKVTCKGGSEDRKKEKNRLSAQISRDKKKQYFSKLEAENQRLKKQLSEMHSKNVELQNQAFQLANKLPKISQNPLKSLLIVLGVWNAMEKYGNIANHSNENNLRESKMIDDLSLLQSSDESFDKIYQIQQQKYTDTENEMYGNLNKDYPTSQ